MKKIALLCCLGVIVFAAGYRLYIYINRVQTIPENLIGTWITTAPGYEERYMEFEEEKLTIGTGPESIELNFITEVQSTEQGGEISYSIRYRNVQQIPFELHLAYLRENGGKFTIRHLENIIWRRK